MSGPAKTSGSVGVCPSATLIRLVTIYAGMGADRNYLAVGLAADGDRSAVISAIESDSRMHYDTEHDGTLVFDGPGQRRDAVERLESVVQHLDHVAMVHYADTAMVSIGYYLERRGDSLVEVDQISSELAHQSIFDYFAREYGVHGAL